MSADVQISFNSYIWGAIISSVEAGSGRMFEMPIEGKVESGRDGE
jgi:hypothetical protein